MSNKLFLILAGPLLKIVRSSLLLFSSWLLLVELFLDLGDAISRLSATDLFGEEGKTEFKLASFAEELESLLPRAPLLLRPLARRLALLGKEVDTLLTSLTSEEVTLTSDEPPPPLSSLKLLLNWLLFTKLLRVV